MTPEEVVKPLVSDQIAADIAKPLTDLDEKLKEDLMDEIAQWYENKRKAGNAAWEKFTEHLKTEPGEKDSPRWYLWSMQRARLEQKAIDAGDCGD